MLLTELTEGTKKDRINLHFNVYQGLDSRLMKSRADLMRRELGPLLDIGTDRKPVNMRLVYIGKGTGHWIRDFKGRQVKTGLYIVFDRSNEDTISFSHHDTFIPVMHTKEGAAYVYTDDVREGYAIEAAKAPLQHSSEM